MIVALPGLFSYLFCQWGTGNSFKTGPLSLNKMAALPIYGNKTLKNNFLQNQESFEADSWYIASGTQGLSGLFK